MNLGKLFKTGALLTGVLSVGLSAALTSAQADNFKIRIAAGHPAPPLASVNQLQKTFVPNVHILRVLTDGITVVIIFISSKINHNRKGRL